PARRKRAHLPRVNGAIQQFLEIDAGDRRGNHYERRERGIAAADVGRIDEHFAELVTLGVAHELRVGIGDGDEVLAGAIALHGLHAIVKIMMKYYWLSCRR